MEASIINEALFSFIEKATTAFHAVFHMEKRLVAENVTKLNEGEKWNLVSGQRYVVTREGALVAFSLGSESSIRNGFRIIGAHTDSPSLQVKPNQRKGTEPYLLAGVEKYGGAILRTWLDRELSLAGRVAFSTPQGNTCNHLIDFRKPLLYIPSLAIHLNRTVNEGQMINVQSDLCPILAQSINDQLPNLHSLIRDQIMREHTDSEAESILAFDLFCYDPNKPCFFGVNNEFIASPRLDNLLSCHIGLEAFLKSGEQTNSLLICANHEEVGSRSTSGALGSFLENILSRIIASCEDKAICLHNSFLFSLDNAHATHPNFKDKSDADHEILLNHGPVIKINASQRYASTAISAALVRILARDSGLKIQDFVMRSDMPCGSTIGPLTSARLGVTGVDIGVPTWGMHSIREVTGSSDPLSLFLLMNSFLSRDKLPTFR